MIDLHLVKHSGIGQSSGGVGRGKSRMVGSVFSCFQNFFLSSAYQPQMGSALASFHEEVGGFRCRLYWHLQDYGVGDGGIKCCTLQNANISWIWLGLFKIISGCDHKLRG